MFRNSSKLFLLCYFFFAGLVANADPIAGIRFIENKNQWPSDYQYGATVNGGRLFVQSGVFTYYFLDEQRLQEIHERTHQSNSPEVSGLNPNEKIEGVRMQATFVGARKDIVPLTINRSTEYYNYFIGNDTCRWASDVHAYQALLYRSLYPGVDMKLYSDGDNLKYDLIVAPGADPNKVKLSYEGTERMLLTNAGDLQVDVLWVQLIEKKPVAFQFINGKKVHVSSRYELQDGELSFVFPEGYDSCYELIIDPLIIFSTYSGSTADNWGSTATPGENGTLYSAGVTNRGGGGSFPVTNGAFQVTYSGIYDVGILKYDSTGSRLLYASYLGGTRTDSPHSLVVNHAGDLLVLGTTSSADFPTSTGAYDRSFGGGTSFNGVVNYAMGSDIFVSQISKNGNQLLSSTLLGGTANDGLNANFGPLTKNYGDQQRGDIIADHDNNVYISTVTASADFPIQNGMDASYNGGDSDAVIVKLNANLTEIIWSSYLGGSGVDASHTIQFDNDGDLFVAGGTTSVDFPVTSGSYQNTLAGDADGWIANINSQGTSILTATLTGTASFDQVYFIDLNSNNEVYVYGQTSGDFPVTANVYSNPNSGQFIQKFNHSLNTLLFSTVVGSGRGIPDISPTAFLVNDCNNIYITGWGGAINITNFYWQNNTVGLPVTADAFQSTTSGSDFYFMVLTDDATEFLYGTYLGGTLSRTHVDGGTSRFDKGGIVYQAVCAGCASRNATNRPTSDFPTTPGAWSNTNNSANCNNAAFKFDLSSLKARIQSNSIKLDLPGVNKICMPDPIVFQNFSTGGETFEWDLGDGTKLVKPDTSMVIHQYASTGKYTVWLKAIDKGTCKVKDSVALKLDVFIADTKVQDDDDVCVDSPYQLKASGGLTYEWISEDGTFTSNLPTPTVTPLDTTTYYITITEKSGCQQKDTVTLNLIPLIAPDFEIDQSAECFERPAIQVRSKTDSLREGDRLYFDFGDGSTTEDTVAQHNFEKDGLYRIKLVGVREMCVTEKLIPMPVFKLFIPNVITPGTKDNSNDKFVIQYGDDKGVTPLTYGFKTAVIIYNRWGTEVYRSDDYQYDWDGEGLESGVYYYEVSVEDHATCKSWLHLIK